MRIFKNIKNRIISIITVALMLFAIMPTGAFCADGVAVNTATNESYATLDDALNGASDGETVRLTADVTAGVLILTPNVHIDLCGHKLTATYVIAFKNSYITDSNVTQTSGIYVTYSNLTLSVENPQLAIYDVKNGCFMFTDVTYEEDDKLFVLLDGNRYYTGPRMSAPDSAARTRANALLSQNSTDTGVEFMIRIGWKTADYDVSQDYFYNANRVETVFSNAYSKVFCAAFEGKGNVTVTTVIKSKGAEFKSVVKEYKNG